MRIVHKTFADGAVYAYSTDEDGKNRRNIYSTADERPDKQGKCICHIEVICKDEVIDKIPPMLLELKTIVENSLND